MAANEHPKIAATPCVSVVMPVFNEVATIAGVISSVLGQPCVEELIVIDDGSSDGSWEAIQKISTGESRIHAFRHETNEGKGAALRAGLSKAKAPIVLIQDADLEYDPAEYETLIGPIRAGKADVVFGSRFGGGGMHRVLYYWHSVGNRLLTEFSNMMTNLNLTDIECCYKAFRREIIQKIRIEENRFGVEPELAAKVARLGVAVYEVSVSYHGRTYEDGKKIGWRDGISALRAIVQYNLLH